MRHDGNGASALVATEISVTYGGLRAVDGVSLRLDEGQILGLIGPNGAGKSTLMDSVSGFVRLAGGTVSLGEAEATGWSPRRLAKHGVARTFQDLQVLPDLSVLENVEVGCLLWCRSRRAARGEAVAVLRKLGLLSLADAPAGAIPLGDERRVGVARAIAMRPSFLLLDEPAAGLDEVESRALAELIEETRDETGCGVLFIEHMMDLIMGLCDRIQVLDHGRTIAVGSPAEVQRDPAVIEAYLGHGLADRAEPGA